MDFGHLFEALMLVCFGFSWPLNVIKAYKARTTKGTSLAFIILIITGYVAGIAAKVINHQMNYVLAVYFLNLAIVMCNVFVYIRNLALDRKNKNITIVKEEETMKPEYEITQSEVIFRNVSEKTERKNQVILVGGSFDQKIPTNQLAEHFKFNFKLYNKSIENLSLKNAAEYYKTVLTQIKPEGIIFHLGENDVSLYQNDSTAFDKYYLDLLATVKKANKNTRLALVSVRNADNNKVIAEINKHIKAIADSEKCQFVNLDNAGLWNPQALQGAVEFAQCMGLNTRKPLSDVAEIVYNYALNEKPQGASVTLVG